MKKYLKLATMLTLSFTVIDASADTRNMDETSPKESIISSRHSADAISGKVIETMDSGGYTYIKLEDKDGNTWVAVPGTKVRVGQKISLYPGASMSNFESNTLNRTFESIIFSSGLIEQDSPAAEKVSSDGKSSASVTNEKIKVDKASGPNAHTVADLYDKKSALDKKNVVVRGKVVKVSANIMKKNWIHIQDGSGNPEAGSHDIIVTSADLPSVGDIVTVSGTLVSDMDIGSGYKFDVLIEEAHIKK